MLRVVRGPTEFPALTLTRCCCRCVSWFGIPRMVCDIWTLWCLKWRDCLAPLSHAISCYRPSWHYPVVSATHPRDMFKTFSPPRYHRLRDLRHAGPWGPTQGPPGSWNKISDIWGRKWLNCVAFYFQTCCEPVNVSYGKILCIAFVSSVRMKIKDKIWGLMITILIN